jgi:iron complex outermembrane receptor protein
VLVVGAHYARTPTLGERFGVDGAVRGNADLSPEHGLGGDLVVRGSFGADRLVRVEVVTFTRWTSDLIDYTKTSPGTVKPINIGSARFLGLEGTVDVRVRADMSLGAVTTLLDAEDTTDGNTLANRTLPFRARHVESVFARFFPSFGELRSLRFEWRTNVEGGRTLDPAGLARIPAQSWSDATLRGRHGILEAAMRWANVFDQTRIDLVGYPMPGRTVDLTLAVETP